MHPDASLPVDAQAALTRASAALHVSYQELANAAQHVPELTQLAELANDVDVSRRSIETLLRPAPEGPED